MVQEILSICNEFSRDLPCQERVKKAIQQLNEIQKEIVEDVVVAYNFQIKELVGNTYEYFRNPKGRYCKTIEKSVSKFYPEKFGYVQDDGSKEEILTDIFEAIQKRPITDPQTKVTTNYIERYYANLKEGKYMPLLDKIKEEIVEEVCLVQGCIQGSIAQLEFERSYKHLIEQYIRRKYGFYDLSYTKDIAKREQITRNICQQESIFDFILKGLFCPDKEGRHYTPPSCRLISFDPRKGNIEGFLRGSALLYKEGGKTSPVFEKILVQKFQWKKERKDGEDKFYSPESEDKILNKDAEQEDREDRWSSMPRVGLTPEEILLGKERNEEIREKFWKELEDCFSQTGIDKKRYWALKQSDLKGKSYKEIRKDYSIKYNDSVQEDTIKHWVARDARKKARKCIEKSDDLGTYYEELMLYFERGCTPEEKIEREKERIRIQKKRKRNQEIKEGLL
ncbi:MAG: hypothetical protein KKE23_03930 [Nanoarchaeota archaeon]|nr:hypothetical protein [Nanoarchaeota archaeon]